MTNPNKTYNKETVLCAQCQMASVCHFPLFPLLAPGSQAGLLKAGPGP